MEKKIKKIIDKIRPYIRMHGGDVELVDIKDGVVKIKVVGACVGCALAGQTYNVMLSGMINEEYPEVKDIVFEN